MRDVPVFVQTPLVLATTGVAATMYRCRRSRFLGLVITMHFDDHDPPHFHALHADGEAKVRIDTLELIDSTLSRRQLRFVVAWAELHQDELLENWRRARAGETLHPIDPLR